MQEYSTCGLRFFAETGDLDKIKRVLKKKYGPNFGKTNQPFDLILKECVKYLEIAATRGHLNVVKYFVEIGCARVRDTHDEMGCCFAFRSAAKCGHLDILKYFVKYFEENAEISVMKSRWETESILNYNLNSAMWTAAFNNKLEIVKYLTSIGCDFLSDSKYFMMTITYESQQILKYLLNLGYDPGQRKYKAFEMCSQTNMFEHMLLYLTKKSFYAYREISKWKRPITKIVSSRIKPLKNFHKHNVLKILLRPTSLHIQLCSSE
jgi:hypothetical protein